jgi:hypothetical protein
MRSERYGGRSSGEPVTRSGVSSGRRNEGSPAADHVTLPSRCRSRPLHHAEEPCHDPDLNAFYWAWPYPAA